MATPIQDDDSGFICEGKSDVQDRFKPWLREACKGRPFYGEHEGKQYCVLHFPAKEKSADFKKALQEKVKQKDYCFRGVWFPDAVYAADFGELVPETNFDSATFAGSVHFVGTSWNGPARFGGATFNGRVSFSGARFFKPANFSRASFLKRAFFDQVVFTRGANFAEAIFADDVDLLGDEKKPMFCETSTLDLQFAKIEKPDQFSIRSVMLRPHWFVEVNAQKFQFTNVSWDLRRTSQEINALKAKFGEAPHRVLAIACWRLADNAEENHRYEEASALRYLAMDSRRLETWRGFAVWRLSWWYWLASGYGERFRRAFVVLLAIWLLAAWSYTHVDLAKPLGLDRALTYSAGVMMLQKPEPRPLTVAAQTIVLLETIIGPVQAALLALAIRRKFMR